MGEYEKLLKECKSKEEEKALYELLVIIQCLKKHERLRNIYKSNI